MSKTNENYQSPCWKCGGDGKHNGKTCTHCSGRGMVQFAFPGRSMVGRNDTGEKDGDVRSHRNGRLHSEGGEMMREDEYDADTFFIGEGLGNLATRVILFGLKKGLGEKEAMELADRVTDKAFEPIEEIADFTECPTKNDTVEEDLEEIVTDYFEEHFNAMLEERGGE